MDALLQIITIWLSANFGLPTTSEVPEVIFTDRVTFALKIGDTRYHQHGIEIVAGYRGDNQTIFIVEEWQVDAITVSAILVHEMVHHMQHRGEIHYSCPGAHEALAYRAQEAWLQLFGRSLASDFGMDPFTVKAMTLCMH